MDLSCRAVEEDDDMAISHPPHIARQDDAGSDDLQFVDDLNMEVMDQPNTPVTSQSQTTSTAIETLSSVNINSPYRESTEDFSAFADVPRPSESDELTENVTNSSTTDVSLASSSSALAATSGVSFGPSSSDSGINASTTAVSTEGTAMDATTAPDDVAVERVEEPTERSSPRDEKMDMECLSNDSVPGSTESEQSEKLIAVPTEEQKTEPVVTVSNIVKHFIEGFTIEESTEPFPVHRSSLLTELQQRTKKKRAIGRRRTIANCALPNATEILDNSRPASASKGRRVATPSSVDQYGQLDDSITEVPASDKGALEPCTICGTLCVNLCFYRGEPFCSRSCIKKRKSVLFANPETAPPKRGRPPGAMTRNKPTYRNSGKIAKVIFSRYRPKSSLSDSSDKGNSFNAGVGSHIPYSYGYYDGAYQADSWGLSESLLNESDIVTDGSVRRSDVSSWTVEEVKAFIQTLSGCEQYGVDFEEQEIDGKALLLLTEDHLLNALNIKFKPAAVIFHNINSFG